MFSLLVVEEVAEVHIMALLVVEVQVLLEKQLLNLFLHHLDHILL